MALHVPAKVTYEYMNPNYKETLDREWWQTSTQLQLSDEVIARIKSRDPSYTVLDASCRELQGSRIEVLAEAAAGNPHITEIDVRGNGFDADGLYALVQALKSMPGVKKLNLRGNTCRNQGVEALADFMATNTTITDISLNENNLCAHPPHAVRPPRALRTARRLPRARPATRYRRATPPAIPLPLPDRPRRGSQRRPRRNLHGQDA